MQRSSLSKVLEFFTDEKAPLSDLSCQTGEAPKLECRCGFEEAVELSTLIRRFGDVSVSEAERHLRAMCDRRSNNSGCMIKISHTNLDIPNHYR